MKILLTGKNGQVGFELRRALAPLGEVVAVDREECNLADEQNIRELVRRIRPNVIVNPAAYTAVDKAETERELAYAINANAPGIFGEEAAALGAWVVHYSTDYVFDGTKDGFYQETDTPNPQSVYGASKWEGEQALQASGAHHLIFRTSWVVGAHGNNFAKTILRLAKERTSLNIVSDQFGAPTSAALLADVTAHAIHDIFRQRNISSLSGIYHLTASGVTNWYEYASYVIEQARQAGVPIAVPADAIHPIGTKDYPTPAQRPANSRLDTQKARQTFEIFLPDWKNGINHVLEQLF